jgi:hypothetical protein
MPVLRRLALPLFLVALLAGSALAASSANQTRGKTNRAAVLKNREARGEKGRVRTRYVRDSASGKSSLVKVMKLDSSGKATGQVEAYMVNKATGVARRTSVASLKSKKARPTTKKKTTRKVVVSKKGTRVATRTKKPAAATASDATAQPAAEVAAAVTPAPEKTAPETTAPETAAPSKAPATTAKAPEPVVKPMLTAARSAVMNDPMVANSESVAKIDADAITPAEAMAMAVVEQRLKVTGRSSYDVAPTFEQSRGDKSNPVTGSGMIELVAVQKVSGKQNLIRRFFHAFIPKAQRRVELMLDAEGRPAYMVDRPDSLPYRLVRRVFENVPIREFVNDVVRSDGVRKGGIMAVLGGSVAVMTGPVGWGVAGVVAPMAWKTSVEGIRQRRVARQNGLNEAVTEIKKSLGDGKTVTIEEAYETYKAKLGNIKEGTTLDAPSTPATPISRRDFVKAISAPPHNL